MENLDSTAWAKIARDDPRRWHSLIGHSIDVAAAFRALVGASLTVARLGSLAGRILEERCLDRLAVLALLHDIGKANRGFQARRDPRAPRVGHLLEVGGVLQAPETCRPFEEGVLAPTLLAWVGDEEAVCRYLQAMLSHHGTPVTDAWLPRPKDEARWWRPHPGGDPVGDVLALVAAARRAFPRAFAAGGAPLPAAPAFLHAYAGLLQLADWIGSNETWFPFDDGSPAEDRFARSLATAEAVLRQVGFARAERPLPEPAFAALFADRAGGPRRPRPLQVAAAAAPGRLVLLEAETGAGKTEAALYRFARLYGAGEVDALYFALPTRIAASQIHARVRDFAARFLPPGSAEVLLATPGDARVEEAAHPLPARDDTWAERPEADGEPFDAKGWAAERPKRFLAARIAVGTIDQALLAALRSRHAHMRAACLARSLLVIDEVHASDTYMTAVLRRLLANHLRAGGHALLMSATLGSAAAAGLLAPGTAVELPPLERAMALSYPLLRGEAIEPREIAREGAPKTVALEARPVIDQPEAVAALAARAAEAGAKVLVVRNTVASAQATLAALERDWPGAPVFTLAGRRTLHHGRFARADRRRLDAEVEAQVGRERPPGGLVLAGTQTLEQSLDIDADLLVTDLCPMDVLLQRIGRLHRHHGRGRPDGFGAARAVILVPSEAGFAGLTGRFARGFGDPEGGRAVYRDLLGLRATLDLIAAHPTVTIPDRNRELVERSTHPEALRELAERLAEDDDPAWLAHWENLRGKGAAERMVADLHGLDMARPFGAEPFFDDEDVLTRLGVADRLLPLPGAPTGPFGARIEEIALPGHWAWVRALPAEAVAEAITPLEGGFAFRAGGVRLAYDRLGLRRHA